MGWNTWNENSRILDCILYVHFNDSSHRNEQFIVCSGCTYHCVYRQFVLYMKCRIVIIIAIIIYKVYCSDYHWKVQYIEKELRKCPLHNTMGIFVTVIKISTECLNGYFHDFSNNDPFNKYCSRNSLAWGRKWCICTPLRQFVILRINYHRLGCAFNAKLMKNLFFSTSVIISYASAFFVY